MSEALRHAVRSLDHNSIEILLAAGETTALAATFRGETLAFAMASSLL